MQPLFRDDGEPKVLRFQANAIVRYLADLIGLNDVVRYAQRYEIDARDLAQFYQLIGYSVSGFLGLDSLPEEVKRDVDAAEKDWLTGSLKFGIVHPSDRPLCVNGDVEVWSGSGREPLLFATRAEAEAHVGKRIMESAGAGWGTDDWTSARVVACVPGRPRVHPEWDWTGELEKAAKKR